MGTTNDLDDFHACLKQYQQKPDPELAKRSIDTYKAVIQQDPQRAIFPSKYTIDSVLGVGTATYVFKVLRDDGSPVALKVLKRPAQNDSLTSFRQELEKLRGEKFERVAHVYEIFTDPCHAGFTLAYAEGESLEFSRPVKPPDGSSDAAVDKYYLKVAELALKIAEGVKELHDQSILHLDLRPGNVIRRADGNITIVDCHCLTLQLAMVPVAGPEALAAVLPFVAPEVLEGPPRSHSDVYSFGKLIVYIMEGKADANAAHDALQELAERAPKLAVMLRAAIDSSVDQRPQDFDQIVAGLDGAVKSLEERIKATERVPFPPPDFVGLIVEFVTKYFRGELSGSREWTLGTFAFCVAAAAFSAKVFEKKVLVEFASSDSSLLACSLVIFSYLVQGVSYFAFVSRRVRFWREPGRDYLRFFMSFWYVLPILVALRKPEWWPFCAAVGMTVVAVFNWSLWSYLAKPRINPKYFAERRLAHEAMVKFIYFVNSVFGSLALWAISVVLVWMRLLKDAEHVTHCSNLIDAVALRCVPSFYIMELTLAVFVTVVNLAVWWFAVMPNAIRDLGLITGMELEYEIRDWTFAHSKTAGGK